MITERTLVPPRYRLLEEVGQGGMAIVYLARDESLQRDVAIKVLHAHLSAETESKARLEREAQAVAKLKHDNILEIFDYSGSQADSAYIVTEYIDGITLKEFAAHTAVKHPEVAMMIAVELGAALAHAHGLGVIHRDVKPENVMIRKDGLLKLMDFGIAQVMDLERMTVTGQLLGSPAYMAPELIEGRRLDVRTDVFSMGILLYQLTTGALPFSGKNPHETLRRISEGRFADARSLNPLCGDGLHRIMVRALAREPDDRYPSMQDFVTDLREQLAEAGLVDVRTELRDYFREPAAYESALPARMTPSLTKRAQDHLAAGTTARAIECWNRVLAYAPQDQVVLAALNDLTIRNRRRSFARTALTAMAVAALVGGVATALVRGVRSERHPPVTATETPPAGLTPALPARSPAAPPGGVAPRPPEARPSPARSPRAHASTGPSRADSLADGEEGPPERSGPAPAQKEMRTFTLGPTPQNVDVYLDGELQFAYDTDHRSLDVPWTSNHLVEFRSPSGCCFVERIEVGPDRALPPESIIARQLKWKPARLVVTTSPEAPKNARVMVRDPEHTGHGAVVDPGEEANVPFFPTDEGQKEIEISIDSPAGFVSERVTVRAGERKVVVLTLGTAAP